jgi:multisubunit Na+/H+ antiporter MnhB subunit
MLGVFACSPLLGLAFAALADNEPELALLGMAVAAGLIYLVFLEIRWVNRAPASARWPARRLWLRAALHWVLLGAMFAGLHFLTAWIAGASR